MDVEDDFAEMRAGFEIGVDGFGEGEDAVAAAVAIVDVVIVLLEPRCATTENALYLFSPSHRYVAISLTMRGGYTPLFLVIDDMSQAPFLFFVRHSPLATDYKIQAKMARRRTESRLRATHAIVYCWVDSFIPLRGKIAYGFAEFCVELREANIPCIWLTSRSRAQLDEPLRKLDHQEPFIAEGGSGVYVPVDYFHLPVEKSERRGRFLCIPVAQAQPAAAEALESLSEDTGVEAVALRALSPHELAQNSGLPQREAELAKQRDFDEPFFFAGATGSDIERFRGEAARRKLQLRPRGVMWSLTVGASVPQCVREITKLYDRALHGHTRTIAVAPAEEAADAIAACDRQFLVGARPVMEGTSPGEVPAGSAGKSSRTNWISLGSMDDWEELARQIAATR